MIKGILFDKDGTLLKFDELWNEATKNVVPGFLNEIGIDADKKNVLKAEAAIGKSIAAMTYCDMTNAVLKAFGINADEDRLHEYSKQLEKLYFNEVTKSTANIVPTANLPKLFNWLSDKNIIVGLATADTKQTAIKCLDSLGIMPFFSYLGSDDGRLRPKPQIDIIEDFKSKFGINFDEIMVVGDTNTDMQFAKNGGALAVGVLSGVDGEEELNKNADLILDDVSQLIYNWKKIDVLR